jgi:uncharacterized protein
LKMPDIYLHGLQTIESNNGPRPVQTINSGVIGIVFTAPAADPAIWPLDTPVAVYGYQGFPSGLGTTGTGADAFEAIFKQATRASQTIVGIRVADGGSVSATMANIIGSSLNKTGMHALRNAPALLGLKPKLLVAPGFTSLRPTNGVLSIAVGAGGTGYTSAPTVTIAGGGGVGATAEAVISAGGVVTSIKITNPGSGYTTVPTIALTGGAGAGATGTATTGTTANPVAIELISLANRLRACAIVDAPNSTSSAAVVYRGDFATDRLLIVEPHVMVQRTAGIVAEPASARIAGLQAVIDAEEGFWVSPSNHVVQGVLGTSRAIEHSLNDPAVESQFLNQNAVAAIVRSPSGGYKLWGSRVPSGDSLKLFWSVRRSHDVIIESIELAHEPFIDRPFGVQVLLDIAETVNAALRRWKALGATLGGRVWLDASLNTALTWAQGKIYISYDAEAPAPMEQITFMFNRNTGYYEELAADAVREIARLSGRVV